MRLTLVAAMAQNRTIGLNGQLPWHLPADLAHFKALTLGHPILMGRLTYESIGRPLPKRRNLVLTRTKDFKADGIEVFHSLDTAIEHLTDHVDELMIIGGGQIYAETLPFADRIQLTVVHGEVDGDAFFPCLETKDWMVTQRVDHPIDDTHSRAFSLLQLDRSVGSKQLPKGFPYLSSHGA